MRNSNARRHTLSVLTLSASLLAFAGNALALDAEELIKRYQKLAEEQGQTFAYQGIEGSGSEFTVLQPSWAIPGMSDIKAESARFSGVEEGADGSINIGSIDVSAITSGTPAVTVAFDSAAMKDLRIPADGESDPLKKIMYYARFETGKGTITADGQEVGSIGSSLITLSPYTADAPIEMKMDVSDIAADLSAIKDPKFQKGLSDLGYDGRFTGRVAMEGDWSLSSGVLNIPTYDLVIDNVATLSFPMTISGYTADKLVKLQKQSQEMKNLSQAEREQQSMEMFSDFGLVKIAILFKDDSITKRGLEMAAKQSGQPADALAAGAPFMIGAGMGGLNMPEFTQMVATAVGQFLQNPGTLSISAEPKEPVLVKDIVSAAQTNPQGIPELLNVKVEAQ